MVSVSQLNFNEPPPVLAASHGMRSWIPPIQIACHINRLRGRGAIMEIDRHNKHLINVFVWPDASVSASTQKVANFHGYFVITRNVGGFRYRFASDLNEKELSELADLLEK
jgi:hypothetical protein